MATTVSSSSTSVPVFHIVEAVEEIWQQTVDHYQAYGYAPKR